MSHGDLSRAETQRLIGWDYCRACGFPYEIEDLIPVCDPWTGKPQYFLCRWHTRKAHAEAAA